MRLQLLSLAVKDLNRGKWFYEKQSTGLGEYFYDSLFSDIDSLLLYAGIHKKVVTYHCMLSKRFPYTIYYKVADDVIKVYRILDCRQDPRKLEHYLKRGRG
jgi:hypothetical protein